jgi:hypothetical protein
MSTHLLASVMNGQERRNQNAVNYSLDTRRECIGERRGSAINDAGGRRLGLAWKRDAH